MSFSSFIENLQNKPKPVKLVILWVSVVISMTIIFVFWLMTLNLKIQNQKTGVAKSEPAQSFQEVKKEIPGVWQTLKAGIAGLFDSINNKEEPPQKEPETKVEFEKALPSPTEPQNNYYYDMLPN